MNFLFITQPDHAGGSPIGDYVPVSFKKTVRAKECSQK